MTPVRAAGRESGIALVEMLAALSVIAVMAALMAGVLGQMRAIALRHGEAAMRVELGAAADHLQRTLAMARPLPVDGAGEAERIVLDGSADAVRFAAPAPRGFVGRALRTVALRSEMRNGALALIQELTPRRPGAAASDRVLIVEGLAAARFSYADTDGVFGPAWRRTTLPAAIRVTLSRQMADGRRITMRRIAGLR